MHAKSMFSPCEFPVSHKFNLFFVLFQKFPENLSLTVSIILLRQTNECVDMERQNQERPTNKLRQKDNLLAVLVSNANWEELHGGKYIWFCSTLLLLSAVLFHFTQCVNEYDTAVNIKVLEEYMTPPHFNFVMTNEMHTPPPFYGHFSGTTWMSWCQNTISGLLWCKGGNRGRHTTIRMSATPSGLIGYPPPTSPLVFTLDALPAASLSLYPGLGQAPSMLVCIPSGMVNEMHTMWYY